MVRLFILLHLSGQDIVSIKFGGKLIFDKPPTPKEKEKKLC
jgi:hypothetical protein